MAFVSARIYLSLAILLSTVLMITANSRVGKLNKYYYKKSCPQLEKIVSNSLKKEHDRNPNISAQMIRLLFHDVLINGVDASLLLLGLPDKPAERDLNLRLDGFDFIESTKAKVEQVCPKTVSCADVLTLLSKAATYRSGGPLINFKLGRLDGPRNPPEAHDAMNPKASFNASQLLNIFAKLGLDATDLVALSGAHTLGVTRCSRLRARMYPTIDPRYDPSFGASLKQSCPIINASTNPVTLVDQTIFFDQTPFRFDNNYYKLLYRGRGVQNSDQVLTEDSRLKSTTKLYANNYKAFGKQFVKSMIKMTQVNLSPVGEVRVRCGYMNADL